MKMLMRVYNSFIHPKPKFKIGEIVTLNKDGEMLGIYGPNELLRVEHNQKVQNGYTVYLNGGE